ncbi:MAG: hypothetical protein AAGA60_30780 [Cyanobacteria bacterium P01_E01_bin.42]
MSAKAKKLSEIIQICKDFRSNLPIARPDIVSRSGSFAIADIHQLNSYRSFS